MKKGMIIAAGITGGVVLATGIFFTTLSICVHHTLKHMFDDNRLTIDSQ